MWALVVYSLAIFTASGQPWAVSFHPADGPGACRAHAVEAAAELHQAGYVGRCQWFTPGRTPRWPG